MENCLEGSGSRQRGKDGAGWKGCLTNYLKEWRSSVSWRSSGEGQVSQMMQ